MEKTIRRVRKFSILRGNKSYKDLKNLCQLSTNMYNATLFILRHMSFASFPKKGHTAEFYLSRLPKEFVDNYMASSEYVLKPKDGSGERKMVSYKAACRSESSEGRFFYDEKALYTYFLKTGNEDYKSIQCTAARNAVKLAVKSMKSYGKQMTDFSKNPGKYLGVPKIPNYRKNGSLVPFTVDNFKTNKKDGSITVNGNVVLDNVHFSEDGCVIKQIRIVPKPTEESFVAEVVFEKTVDVQKAGNGEIGIDIGVDNICAMSTDSGKCFLVSGKPVKSINQFYNKRMASLQAEYDRLKIGFGHRSRVLTRKRNSKINTFMHQVSRHVVDYARDNGIGRITVGHNPLWKTECRVGNEKGDKIKHWWTRRNNQNFVQIPFQKMVEMIRYKGEEYGIEVVERTEEYTSKCSALDNEEICKHENGTYKGERGGRHNKKFITSDKKLIHADINASLNILRLGSGKDLDGTTPSMFSPTKFKHIGSKGYEMQSQSSNGETCVEYGIEATVDGHSDGKPLPKEHTICLTSDAKGNQGC